MNIYISGVGEKKKRSEEMWTFPLPLTQLSTGISTPLVGSNRDVWYRMVIFDLLKSWELGALVKGQLLQHLGVWTRNTVSLSVQFGSSTNGILLTAWVRLTTWTLVIWSWCHSGPAACHRRPGCVVSPFVRKATLKAWAWPLNSV